jgi:hypothetical protein
VVFCRSRVKDSFPETNPGGGLHDMRFQSGTAHEPRSPEPVTHDLELVFHNKKSRFPRKSASPALVEGSDSLWGRMDGKGLPNRLHNFVA